MNWDQRSNTEQPRERSSTTGTSPVGKRTLVDSLTISQAGTAEHEPSRALPRSQLADASAAAFGSGSSGAVVQRSPGVNTPGAAGVGDADLTLQIAPPRPAIDKTGFVDNSKGARLYNRPAETGGSLVRDTPLPAATRVFVSGTDPRLPHWWYVTAYLDQGMMRGYVQDFRVNTNLPEPFAELRQLHGGETAEGLAKERFSDSVADGHDLRYYENVLLYVNRGRAGIRGTYQDPGILGGGGNNIQLVAGHRIWLVSPGYAKALESVVPSGSLTGGAVAKVKRFAGHLQDILRSVTESGHYFDEVAGEFGQAIHDHLPEIIGITAGFLMAEATSLFLAAVPSGVSQAAAVVIQLALSAFGAAGMVVAGVEALKHANAWLTIAWTAQGKPERVAEASKEFLRMLVAIAVAAVSYIGAKGNYRNAVKIAGKIPTGGLPAFATTSKAASSGALAGTSASVGASTGGFGAAGNAALRLTDNEKSSLGEGPDVDGLHDKEINETRSREREERHAADGRSRPEGNNATSELHEKPRTELAEHIPPPGDAFIEWFDSLTLRELDKLLADKSLRGKAGAAQVIADNIRHPGSQHEWLMVAEARKFKEWGVSMRTIREGRTFTDATAGRRFRHGGPGSGRMHIELRGMIRSSNSYAEFLEKLNQWADRELVPSHSTRWPNAAPLGRYSLPDNLQLRGNR